MADSHGGGETAHTEADGHGGGFPPFESSTFASQLVSLAIAFVLLYVIVSRIALPRVGAVIDARANKIEGDLAEAQKLKDDSEAALKAYEADLAAARDKLNAASEAERKALEDKLSVKLAEAEKTIAATRASAMSNVRGIAADAAGAIVQRLTGATPDSSAVASAVDASLKG
jgi:F-type H+-transporting ATPase subunit b